MSLSLEKFSLIKGLTVLIKSWNSDKIFLDNWKIVSVFAPSDNDIQWYQLAE